MNTQFVSSNDGTKIAYETRGNGPPLVFVWGALGSRGLPFAARMREELARSFTVYDYDRRGRGESGDVGLYAVEREIDDLRAVCETAGGLPFVCGTSSGAALALEAAAAGVPMRMLAAHEPPYAVGAHAASFDRDYEQHVTRLVRLDQRSEAVKYFMRAVGVPTPVIWVMRLMPLWRSMVHAAHTLPYDAAVMRGFHLPEQRFRDIRVPTLVLVGGSTPARLRAAADEVTRVIPDARERVIPRQNHGIKPAALRPVLDEEFAAATRTAPRSDSRSQPWVEPRTSGPHA
ncbi:MAG: alpha/beta fold hydrolase [Deltaproteobacteria bacterium]|nr:alpha/beta fold hydrolase [Deltaproteobacteria bacterium]